MEQAEKRQMLTCIDALCRRQGEIDAALLARELGGQPPHEVQVALDELETAGLITVNEYGFSCSVETMVEGLTEAGRAVLQG